VINALSKVSAGEHIAYVHSKKSYHFVCKVESHLLSN